MKKFKAYYYPKPPTAPTIPPKQHYNHTTKARTQPNTHPNFTPKPQLFIYNNQLSIPTN